MLYSGPMNTMGQHYARLEGYEKITSNLISVDAKDAESHKNELAKMVDISPLDSTGELFSIILNRYAEGALTLGKFYKIYGASVNDKISNQKGKIMEMQLADYLWEPFS